MSGVYVDFGPAQSVWCRELLVLDGQRTKKPDHGGRLRRMLIDAGDRGEICV